jgi:hypothetical protein
MILEEIMSQTKIFKRQKNDGSIEFFGNVKMEDKEYTSSVSFTRKEINDNYEDNDMLEEFAVDSIFRNLLRQVCVETMKDEKDTI